MDIAGIQLTNFCRHRNTNISLTGGLVGVFGPNGAGKSSLIVDAPTWCLWGKSRFSGAGDGLISTGQTYCEVAVSFRVNQKLWKVTRTRIKDSKTLLELSEWGLDRWDDVSGATIDDTQNKIINILGMSYKVFRNSSCIEQGQANSFSNLTPADAASVILDILQLNKYKRYRQVVSEKIVILERTVNDFTSKVKLLEVQLATYTNSHQIYQDTLQKVTALQQQYNMADIDLKDGEFQSHALLEQLAELSSYHVSKETLFNAATLQLKKSEDQQRLLAETGMAEHCPLCKTLLTENALADLQTSLKQNIAELRAEQQILHLDMANNQSQIVTDEGRLRALKLDSKRMAFKTLEKQLMGLNAELKALEATAVNSDALVSEITNAKEYLEKTQKNLAICIALQEAFGPKGIPLLVVDNVVKELEIAINSNLKLLTDLPLSIQIATQHAGRSGELADTFEIVLNDGLEVKPYAGYSGGEKLLIDLAIRLGLSELLAKRNNFKVETLIIDEGLGSLDEPNQLNFFKTLTTLEKKFKHVLVITHTQVKDCFEQRIELVKDNGITRVDKRAPFGV